MINMIKELEAKVKELEKKIEGMHDGMLVFNHNFQAVGNALSIFSEKLETVETKVKETPQSHHMGTVH